GPETIDFILGHKQMAADVDRLNPFLGCPTVTRRALSADLPKPSQKLQTANLDVITARQHTNPIIVPQVRPFAQWVLDNVRRRNSLRGMKPKCQVGRAERL